jgi:hypothetical protein
MSLLSPFVGSPQSWYAGVAIFIAIGVVSFAILFGADAMPLSQKFFFIILLLLISAPGIMLSLLQLTCLVTGTGSENRRWWCTIYAWVMSIFLIFYSCIIIVITFQDVVNTKETFANINENFKIRSIQSYPAEYPPNSVPSPRAPFGMTDGLEVNEDPNKKNQYIINEKILNEHFLGQPDMSAFK